MRREDAIRLLKQREPELRRGYRHGVEANAVCVC